MLDTTRDVPRQRHRSANAKTKEEIHQSPSQPERNRTRKQDAVEEMALEYFRTRPRYQVWKVIVAAAVAAVMTFLYVSYRNSIHDAAEALRDAFEEEGFVGRVSAVSRHANCTDFTHGQVFGCSSDGFPFQKLPLASTRDTCSRQCQIILGEFRDSNPHSPGASFLCCYYNDGLGCHAKPGARKTKLPGDVGDVAMCSVS